MGLVLSLNCVLEIESARDCCGSVMGMFMVK